MKSSDKFFFERAEREWLAPPESDFEKQKTARARSLKKNLHKKQNAAPPEGKAAKVKA